MVPAQMSARIYEKQRIPPHMSRVVIGQARRVAFDPDVIVSEIGRQMLVDPEEIISHLRRAHVCDARHAMWLACSKLGRNPSEISRLFGFDHSTIMHGLARASSDPHLRLVAREAANLCGHGGLRRVLGSWLRRGMRFHMAQELQAVEAYAACSLLGWERRAGVTCAYGLMLVMSNPDIRGALEEALRRCDQAPTVGLIELQAAQHRRRAG